MLKHTGRHNGSIYPHAPTDTYCNTRYDTMATTIRIHTWTPTVPASISATVTAPALRAGAFPCFTDAACRVIRACITTQNVSHNADVFPTVQNYVPRHCGRSNNASFSDPRSDDEAQFIHCGIFQCIFGFVIYPLPKIVSFDIEMILIHIYRDHIACNSIFDAASTSIPTGTHTFGYIWVYAEQWLLRGVCLGVVPNDNTASIMYHGVSLCSTRMPFLLCTTV